MSNCYKRYNGNDSMRFPMKFENDKQIAEYNRLVDKLNDDLDKRDKLEKRLREEIRSKTDDPKYSDIMFLNARTSIELWNNEEYKALWESHSETYDKYMDMQEDAILRAHETEEHDSKEKERIKEYHEDKEEEEEYDR